jgi:putative colanic acid biosynthesis acetyltransferase WcaF
MCPILRSSKVDVSQSSPGSGDGDANEMGGGRRMRVRSVPPPSGLDKLRRLLWGMVQATLYRWSPVAFHGWRRLLLRLFGANVGTGAHPYPSARIWAPWNLEMGDRSCLGPRSICYTVGRVRLGADAIVSQGAHLCAATHDHRDPTFPLVVGDIKVGAGAWVAADAFIGPGVAIGDGAVVGARAVVVKDVEACRVVVGNPARFIGVRESVGT